MNQKNTLGLDICFQDLKNPIELFKNWMDDAIKSEPNDPNALALATSDKNEIVEKILKELVKSKEDG